MDFLGWSVNILLVLLGSAALFAMSIVSFVIIVFFVLLLWFLKRRSSDGLACSFLCLLWFVVYPECKTFESRN